MGMIVKECALVLAIVIPLITGLPTYPKKIPNGENVANPFDNGRWDGVGHWNPLGGGTLNPFGQAFQDNGHIWNEALCYMDSDLDGVANGVELCDPDCTWREGDDQPTCPGTTYVTHPGICEPIDDPVCQELNEDADVDAFKCDVIEEEETKSFIVKPKPIEMRDNEDTTYYCQLHELPHDREYHVVAAEPIVDTAYIHHIEVYACSEAELSANDNYVREMYGGDGAYCRELAGMVCANSVALWTIGYDGFCLDGQDYGVRIGGPDRQWALVEHHWNNPDKEAGLVDQSGLEIYYTPNMRTHDMGTYQVVEYFLNIPPNVEKHTDVAVCGPDCTTRPYFPEDCINLVSSHVHMHYLGLSAVFSITNSTGTTVLAVDEDYDYLTPIVHEFASPVKVCRGDTLTVTCDFKSAGTHHENYIHFGESADEEMCVGYIQYYPAMPDVTYCLQSGEVNFCESNINIFGGDTERGCDLIKFMSSSAVLYHVAEQVAVAPECAAEGCSAECMEYLKCKQYNKHNCFKYNDLRYTMHSYLVDGYFPNYKFLGEKMQACYLLDPSDSYTCPN